MPTGEGEHALMNERSLVSLLLLGVGWFVLAIAALVVFVVAAYIADPKGGDARALLVPVLPLVVGGALVYGGLRIGRKRAPHKKLVL